MLLDLVEKTVIVLVYGYAGGNGIDGVYLRIFILNVDVELFAESDMQVQRHVSGKRRC